MPSQEPQSVKPARSGRSAGPADEVLDRPQPSKRQPSEPQPSEAQPPPRPPGAKREPPVAGPPPIEGEEFEAQEAAPESATETPPRPSRHPLRAVVSGLPPWSVSLVVHLIGLLVLAFWTLLAHEEQRANVLVAATVEETELEIQDLAEFELEKLEDIQLETVSLEVQTLAPGAIELAALDADALSVLEVPAVADVATHEIGALFGDRGDAMSTVGEGLAAASFFGAKAQGSRFVFVVDNSNSMGRGRFETALDELMKTVEGMAPYQQFYVIFFSDTAYRLYHPDPARQMVRATDENKQKLRQWLGTVEMCLKTKGEEAMQAAFALRPDVIYILGDGRFTDRAGALLVAPHQRKVPIHTLGMEVDAIGKREFQAIARANNGTYRNVSPSRKAQTMARTNPIKRNSSRGYVWGITLPEMGMARRRR